MPVIFHTQSRRYTVGITQPLVRRIHTICMFRVAHYNKYMFWDRFGFGGTGSATIIPPFTSSQSQDKAEMQRETSELNKRMQKWANDDSTAVYQPSSWIRCACSSIHVRHSFLLLLCLCPALRPVQHFSYVKLSLAFWLDISIAEYLIHRIYVGCLPQYISFCMCHVAHCTHYLFS